MNSAAKAAIFSPQIQSHCCFQLRAALFHATPVLERKRRNFWNCRFSGGPRRGRKQQGKQSMLRNMHAYTDYLFQNMGSNFDEEDPSSSRGPSWFKNQYSKGSKQNKSSSHGTWRSGKKGFQFCEDDFDVEEILRSSFGGNQFIYWSFVDEENPQRRSSSGYTNYSTRNFRYKVDYDYDSSPEFDDFDSESESTSHRLALGLSASGPLKLEDVKHAYRTCALKWHPDRHQGSSKAVAEEKFKHCSSAYQSLCDKLAAD
ncbi:Chaperone DnaJ-domain superfamily protein [Euphorbia peplus]|nr:Chaperone DnaJ-domain superfamily protein [Euphorbia peplus]